MYIFILLSSSNDDDVGTSMEGNFLGGTKNTKKVVHFECGSTQGKWFGGGASHQPCCCWFDMHDSKGSKTNFKAFKMVTRKALKPRPCKFFWSTRGLAFCRFNQ